MTSPDYVFFKSTPTIKISLILALALASTYSLYKITPEKATTKQLILFPCIAAVAAMLYWAVISISIPLIHTQVTGAHYVTELTITSKIPERTGKGCHYRIYVESKQISPDGHTCVSKEIWSNIESGDRIIADIQVGVLGTYISTLRLK